jgi:hypothetical protein
MILRACSPWPATSSSPVCAELACHLSSLLAPRLSRGIVESPPVVACSVEISVFRPSFQPAFDSEWPGERPLYCFRAAESLASRLASTRVFQAQRSRLAVAVGESHVDRKAEYPRWQLQPVGRSGQADSALQGPGTMPISTDVDR